MKIRSLVGSRLGMHVAAALLLLLAVQSAQSGIPPLIRRKVLFNDVERTDMKISPDSKWIASLARVNGVVNLWVRHVGLFTDTVLTNEKKFDIQSYCWSPDSKSLLFIGNGQQYGTALYSVPVTGGDKELLAQSVSRIVGTSKSDPTHILVERDGSTHEVYRLKLSDKKLEQAAKNPGGAFQWLADNKLDVRGALAHDKNNSFSLKVRDYEGDYWREIAHWSATDGAPTLWGFSPDNQSIYAGDSRGFPTRRAVSISTKDGKVTVIASDSVYDAEGVLQSPIDNHLEAVYFYRERLEWTLIDTNLTRDSTFLYYMDGDNRIVSRDDNDSLWIIRSDKDLLPVKYVLFSHRRRNTLVQALERPALEKYTLAARNPISFTARDGKTVHGYLTLPNGLDPDTAAMVVIPTPAGSRAHWGFDSRTQWLSNRGYAVLEIDTRGSTGYSRDYKSEPTRNHDVSSTDLIDGTRWVLSQGFIDSTRIAVWAEGKGTGSAVYAAETDTGLFCCAVFVDAAVSMPPLKTTPSRPSLVGFGRSVPQNFSIMFSDSWQRRFPAVQVLRIPEAHFTLSTQESRLKFYEATEEFLGKHLKGLVE